MRKNLEKLLKDNCKKIEMLKSKTDKIIIFGAGVTTELYEKCFTAEKVIIDGVVDNDSKKIGTMTLEKQVTWGKNIAKDYGEQALVIISTASDRTYNILLEQVQGQGLICCSIDEYIFASHVNEILACFDSFEDDYSKALYQHVISGRLTHKKYNIPFPYPEQYFAYPEFVAYDTNEVFVDVGAYVGDTLERYIISHAGVFGKIYAFEPDNKNFKAMAYRTERLRKEWALNEDQTILIHSAVGIENTEMVVKTGVQGLGSKLVNGDAQEGIRVNVVSLDDYFKDQHIDFLKADIESYEYDMLRGAEQVIRRDRPKLAICIYHNATDLFRTMLWIKELNLGYKFKLNHHSVTQSETVLYAY